MNANAFRDPAEAGYNVLHQALGPLRWGSRNCDKHSGFQCMTLEFDHVVPHSVGGSSQCDNTVASVFRAIVESSRRLSKSMAWLTHGIVLR